MRGKSGYMSDDEVLEEDACWKSGHVSDDEILEEDACRKSCYVSDDDILEDTARGHVSDDDVLSDGSGEGRTADVPRDSRRAASMRVSDSDVLSDCGPPAAVRQVSCDTLCDEDVLEEAPIPPKRPSFNLILMSEEDFFYMPTFTEEEFDAYLGPQRPVQPPPKRRKTGAPAPRPSQQQQQRRQAQPASTARPTELTGPPLTPAGVARAWWQAARATFTEHKDHRKPEVICHRQPLSVEEVEREVREAWAVMARCKVVQVMPKHKIKKIVAAAAPTCLSFVFRCATHDRADVGENVCGARVTFPTGGSHRGRDPGVNPYCSNSAMSQRRLCSRCSQLFFRLESTVAFVFLSLYALTAPEDDVSPHLNSLARLLHWFACVATYLNRSFFYSDIQTWTTALVNGLVGERPSLAEQLSAGLLSTRGTHKLQRASA